MARLVPEIPGVIDFGSIQALTFDCYGTLIDWEQGIASALTPLLTACGASTLSHETLLASYAQAESRAESGPYLPYRQILATVTRDLASRLGATLLAADDQLLANSITHWPAFSDTPAAMQRLSTRFKLVILSNIDRDLFEQTRPKLGVNLTDLISAEDVRAYKPSPAHFNEALRRLNLPASAICHVAQSLYHDVGIAHSLGFPTVWVNRRHRRAGSGATPHATATPDLEVPDLASLAEIAVPDCAPR